MMINTALFVIFAGLSANIVVQFGLGLQDILSIKQYRWRDSLYRACILFLSLLITWLFFSFVIIPLGLGFLETILLLPLSILFSFLIEKGILFLFSRWIKSTESSVLSAYNGLVFVAVFFVLKAADSVLDALIMSASFSVGYMLSMAIVLEIHKRASIEAVPRALRGAPLLLITLGLLSLVCSAAAAFFLQMLTVF
jgi:electron transport complex protein RnfA